ncbi:tubby-like F-box protein 11 [Miscanthus floridulus]|uniref:tubby-like F-box protein 11 n=1 Tax=Miscanthus floridulus TaxID=154761 RepID=UPI00345929D5
MPFSSMIQEMKGEIGAISSRGLLLFRSDRPGGHAAAGRAPAAAEPDEALRESCWAQVPPELLRMVLVRVEDEEARWPGRSAVVASAGVCRCWRAVVKEMVRVPEESGKFTFPISLKQPAPRDAPIKCFIRRNRVTQSYSLCVGVTDALADDGKFLLAARRSRRPAGTEYLISLDAKNTSKGTYIGKLRSNFLGTKFTVYDAHPPCAGAVVSKGPSARMIGSAQVSPGVPAGNYPISHISYEATFGSRAPRKINCVMDSIHVSAIKGGTAPMQTEFPSVNSNYFASVPFFRKSGRLDSSGVQLATQNEAKIVLKNKSPRWHEPLQCWCLNFHGRVTVASVKNFQLVASGESDPNNQDDDDVILQFGKIGKDLFTMDYRYPISAFQAFAICLSSFDTKITRE